MITIQRTVINTKQYEIEKRNEKERENETVSNKSSFFTLFFRRKHALIASGRVTI